MRTVSLSSRGRMRFEVPEKLEKIARAFTQHYNCDNFIENEKLVEVCVNLFDCVFPYIKLISAGVMKSSPSLLLKDPDSHR